MRRMAMMDMRLLVVAVAVLVAVVAVAEGNVVFKVKHKYGGRGSSVLPELKAHDSRRHGRMLASVDFQLGGNGQPTDAALVLYHFVNFSVFQKLLVT